VLPAGSPAAGAGGAGDQQQDRAGAASGNGAPPGRGCTPTGRAAAVAEYDAHAGSAHAAVFRCATGAEVVQQPRDSRPNAGRHSHAQHRRPAPESETPIPIKPLVTITRQYASGGSAIARLVVERLSGWTL